MVYRMKFSIKCILLAILVQSILGHCPYEHRGDYWNRYWDRYFQYYNPNPQNPYSTRYPAFYESPEGLRYQALYNKCSEKNPDGSCRKNGPTELLPGGLGTRPGFEPGFARQGIPPEFARQGPSPEFTRQGIPPEFARQGPSPEFSRQGIPPEFARQGPSPEFTRQGIPPEFARQGAYLEFTRQGPPPELSRQRPPPIPNDEWSNAPLEAPLQIPRPRPDPYENNIPRSQIGLLNEFDQAPPPYYGSAERQIFENIRQSKIVRPRPAMPALYRGIDESKFEGISPTTVDPRPEVGEERETPDYEKVYEKYYKEYQEYVNRYRQADRSLSTPDDQYNPSLSQVSGHSTSLSIHDSDTAGNGGSIVRPAHQQDSYTTNQYPRNPADRAELPWFQTQMQNRPSNQNQPRPDSPRPSTEPRSMVPQRGVETHAAKPPTHASTTSTTTTTVGPKQSRN
uniref:Enamelin n=1 Tax=Acrobeloides nanus TaxID=290746 RepID=A0A914CT68_9BILA